MAKAAKHATAKLADSSDKLNPKCAVTRDAQKNPATEKTKMRKAWKGVFGSGFIAI